jgi:hypothetical protein
LRDFLCGRQSPGETLRQASRCGLAAKGTAALSFTILAAAMTRDEFDAAITAYAVTERKGPVSNVLKDPELRLAYERAHSRISEAEIQGPHHALVPIITNDGGWIWLRPYWTVGGLAFANHDAASRCFRDTVESVVGSIFQNEQAKWESMYLALSDVDAKRDALAKRLKAQGYRADEIDDIVTASVSHRD